MTDPIFWLTISGAGLIGLGITVHAALAAWRGWLELQRLELDGRSERQPSGQGSSPVARIEIADLKERVRKLEAIAAGVDI